MKLNLPFNSPGFLQLPSLAALFGIVCSLFFGSNQVQADINTINQTVWKMLYGVTDAQMADSNWLNADTDGDGLKNGTEVLAGTNPFDPGSVVKISNFTGTGTTVSLTFPAVKGKQYVVQGSATMTGFLALSPSVFLNSTSQSVRTLVAPMGAYKFFRVLVQDIDSDSDGVSDWAESVVGYNPNSATTIGGTPDGTGLPAALANENKVSITATDSVALQPEGANAPVDVGQVTITRTGTLLFSAITVPLSKSGTAIEGSDYAALANAVVIPKKSGSVVLDVIPTANSALRTNRVATVSVVAGAGFTLLAPASASVAINPAGTANGTGLRGEYQNSANSTYATQTGIFGSAVEMTRTDPTIDFSNGVNGWGAVGGPTGLSPASTNGAFSIRWTGQLLPQFSETYSIDFRSDDGAKVWVNGLLIIDKWVTQSATDSVNTIDLQAGTLYDITIEYFNSATGSAEAKLYWWSASQVKQIIPMSRLFPPPAQAAKFTAITSALAAVGYVSVPFQFNVTSPNIGGTTTYALAASSAALPPGLTLNPGTGLISGTPTTAGAYNVAINATNTAAGGVTGSSIIDFTIFPTGSVTRETLAGAAITPNGTIPTLDDDTDYPNNISRRLRGYIVPPKTGNYYFWLAANNTAEFRLSNDAESISAVRRASVASSTGKKVWNASASQQSQWLSLVAGQRYYYEVLHNTGTDADDYLALGWCQDDVGTAVSVVGAPNGTGARPLIPNGAALRQGYPYSGTVPSYICQPYDYPTVSSDTGTLYAASMGPQGSATTKASGSLNLRVDASMNSAILHFRYNGLSSPRTGYHLHVDAFATHPAGEIVFDIDDIDAFHPELKTADGGYIWNFTTVGTFTSIQQIRDAITQGKVYLNVHSVNFPSGEIRGTLQAVDGSQTPPDPALYAEPAATDVNTNDANAARFLNQATFGASPADIAYVKANGFAAWIDNQLAKPAADTSNEVVAGLTANINTPYPSSLFTNAWWRNSITAEDQLRQRLAFALSEIMVVSWDNNSGPLRDNGRILADYYDQLVDYCLPSGLPDSGNFRGILKQVTLTPAMGLYLDMRGNQKGDATIGRSPNENYARELMQLFSVGLNRMWDDGKFMIDSNASLVPTYTQPTVIGLANLLTGWTYNQSLLSTGRLPTSFSPGADNLNPMLLVSTQHENRTQKLLLNNVVSPAATGLTPRVNISSINSGSPNCTVITSTIHGLKIGDTVTIAGISTGTFTGGYTAINTSHQVVTVTTPTAFTLAVPCTVNATSTGNPTVTGVTVTPAAYGTTGLAAVIGSQADNTNFTGWTLPHPYDQYGMNELELAIDNIVNNDNVAPYVCRQLIQRFVTSDPSPGYVYRVVQKFKNNGSGVRGDLKAVIRQILLDGEARSTTAALASNTFGKQREPVLRLTGAARAFPATAFTGTFTQLPANSINANKLRIMTSAPNDFNSGFSVSLDFSGNYTSTAPPNPSTNPTSTAYSINTTLGIARTHTDIATISSGGTPTIITTAEPHGLTTGNTVSASGVSGTFVGTSLNTTNQTATVIDATTFSVPINTTRSFQVVAVSTGNPCIITTATNHGLTTGGSVTLNGINGGAFSTAINGTFTATVVSPTTFTVPSNCTSPPTSYNTWRVVSNPCRVTTVEPHGLVSGNSVTIAGVSGGTFSPSITLTYDVTVVDPTSFTIPVNCTAPATVNTGSIVGGNTLDVTATGMVNVAYSQPAGSNIMTVSTGGPQTDIAIPVPNSATTTLKSKVYLDVLGLTHKSTASIASIATTNPCQITTTNSHGLSNGDLVTIASVTGGTFSPSIGNSYSVTVLNATQFTVQSNCTVAPTAGTGTVTGTHGVGPADGVYEVQTTNGSTSFTVLTADTPTAARSGNVIVPKISTSYTPQTSNTIVQFNTNVNHNLLAGQNVWVDVPVVGSPLADAEYVVTSPIVDEDHCKTSYLPVTASLGTYPKPSGSTNSVTLYPLVAPPMGRSGSVVVNQSRFDLGSTDGTLSQSPLNAPTVFNFFFPNYKYPGALANNGIDSPEFQISTDTNLTNLTNSVTNMFIGTGGSNGNLNGLSSFSNGDGKIVVNIGSYMTNAKTANSGIPGLVDELANLLVGAPLEAFTRQSIITFVSNNSYFPYTTPTNQQKRDRVRAIIHLILTSAEYSVQK